MNTLSNLPPGVTDEMIERQQHGDLPLFAKRPQDIHPNSIKSLHEEAVKLSKRAALILADIKEHGPGTAREICTRMGYRDMNQVRPRLTELVETHHLRELRNEQCFVTKKTVAVYGV